MCLFNISCLFFVVLLKSLYNNVENEEDIYIIIVNIPHLGGDWKSMIEVKGFFLISIVHVYTCTISYFNCTCIYMYDF